MGKAGAAGSSGRRLVVVSMDGLSEREAPSLPGLPNFGAVLGRGTRIGYLRSVYPSLTYAIHATMVTGRYPETHGIPHNQPLQPGVQEEWRRWHWFARELRAPSLFDLAREAGMSTAAVLWPLCGGGRITWNFPEISALPGENLTLKLLRAGSPAFLLGLEARFRRFRKGLEQPALDGFVSRCAAHAIRTKKPRLLMTHLISLDAAKHLAGSASEAAARALLALDEALGRILEAVEDSGLAAETDIVVLGDHGHIDTERQVRLNLLLEEAGLCGGEGAAFRWRAWFQCAGGSAFLHVRHGDGEAARLAREVLEAAALRPDLGIAAIREGEALEALRCGSGALLAVDARPGIRFEEDRGGPLVEDATAPGALGADHGYPPETPGYRSLFLAAGPRVLPGSDPGEAAMVDVAPTLARIAGLRFAAGDGRAIRGILREGAEA